MALAEPFAGGVFLMGGDDEDDSSGGGGQPGGDADVACQLTLPVTSGDFRIAAPAQNLTDLDREQLAEIGIQDPEGTAGTYLAGVPPTRLPEWRTCPSWAPVRSPP